MTIFGERVPEIDLALIAVGPVVLVGLVALLRGTRWGVLIRATATDPDMAGALGVNARAMFLSAFMLGAFLAGVGGALMVPREPVSLSIDLAIIAEVFVVVVLGGMGSIAGAFVAACLISVLNAFAVLVLPSLSLVLPFVVMGLVLIVRPQGLLGTRASAHGAAVPIAPLRPLPAFARAALVALVPAAAALPFLTDGYALVLLTDLLIALLFAASLQFLMGIGGMVSFGHAAYFGLGAYGAAFTVNALGLPMVAAIGVGVVAALVGAFAFGWFAVRLSGVYLAMLTLAAAQIVWGLTFQLTDVTGGDDGILGVWPARWASGDAAFLWMVIALTALGLAALRHLAHAPFGVMVRAARDHPGRLAALGVDVMRHQWLTFALCGAVAGLAGALLAFAKGSVFPDVLAISQSVDGLVMVLLGGLQSLVGPIFGAGAFVLLEDTLSRLDHWRALFGLMIVAIVLVAPRGLAGLWERRP